MQCVCAKSAESICREGVELSVNFTEQFFESINSLSLSTVCLFTEKFFESINCLRVCQFSESINRHFMMPEGVEISVDKLRVGWVNGLGWVPRKQKMLKGHLPRVKYHHVH